MSVYAMLRTSVSGMAGQANRLGAVSDNIANSSTAGYKAADVEFSTLVVNSGQANYTSGGVESKTRYSISQQGTLAFSSSATDLAISGPGFFVVSSPAGEASLTRAGAFVPDETGALVNTAGLALMGYPIIGGDPNFPVINGTAGLEVVRVDGARLEATPTRQGELRVNVPSEATAIAPADLPSANAATSTYGGRSSIVVFGNLGEEIILDVYFSKTAANNWEVAVYNSADRAVTGGFPYSSAALATQNLIFDGQGQLDALSPTFVTVPVPGGGNMDLDLTGTSQLAADYSVLEVDADGSAPSGIASVDFDSDGTMYAIYENGQRDALYRVPLATVASPDNLTQRSGNVFELTREAGELRIGLATEAGFGSVIGGAIENSNVDIATELTTMIEAQRNYTANSKVFQTVSELIDVLVNLKR